jgi:hypothetical protein
MTAARPFPCPQTAAALARLLDGDLAVVGRGNDGFGGGDRSGHQPLWAAADGDAGDELLGHVRECEACQQALRRARRLDAVLAQGSGRRWPPHGDPRRERWLQAAIAAAPVASTGRKELTAAAAAAAADAGADASPPVVGSRGRRWPVVAAAAAVLGVALLAIGWRLGSGWLPGTGWQRDETAAAPGAGSAPPPAVAPHELPAPLLLPPGSTSWSLRRPLDHSVADQPPTASRLDLQRQLCSELPAATRLAAARELLQRTRPSAPAANTTLTTLLLSLAGFGDRDAGERQLHDEVLRMCDDAAWLRESLAMRLERLSAPGGPPDRLGLATVTVAVRLGTPELDDAVRAVVRRHPDTMDVVAAALRCDRRRDGGTDLLLACWQDLAARGRIPDEVATAARWFHDQPAATYAGLRDQLQHTRDRDRRRVCLLALAAANDAASCRCLAELLHAPRRDEANLAAFALSRLPRPLLQPLVAAAEAADASLLRAALAAADLPASRSWLRQRSLRPDQLHKLRHATADDFPELSSWFRRDHAPRGVEPGPFASD